MYLMLSSTLAALPSLVSSPCVPMASALPDKHTLGSESRGLFSCQRSDPRQAYHETTSLSLLFSSFPQIFLTPRSTYIKDTARPAPGGAAKPKAHTHARNTRCVNHTRTSNDSSHCFFHRAFCAS
jgi:hypothetical protein